MSLRTQRLWLILVGHGEPDDVLVQLDQEGHTTRAVSDHISDMRASAYILSGARKFAHRGLAPKQMATILLSMRCTIRLADFDDPALEVFLRAHLADMAPQSPKESQHALDIAGLRQPGVRLWVAWYKGRIAGTCALAVLEPGHEELKSMRTEPELRGRGIASELLDHVLANARARHVSRISLETGSMEFFAPARALYARRGFNPCPPFGSYKEDPHSSYMTRAITTA